MLTLIKKNIIRRYNAYHYGYKYQKASTFKIPEYIYNNDMKYTITSIQNDIGTFNAFIDIFLEDCYGIKSIDNRKIKKIVDIGSHIGYFSILSRLHFPQAVIHSYEPNPNLQEVLKNNAISFGFDVYNEAVGNAKKNIHLLYFEDSVKTCVDNSDNIGEIVMIPFSECIERIGGTVDLLKLDCEGSEWNIFKDVNSFKNVKNITMEYHLINGHSMIELNNIFKNNGFIIKRAKKLGPTWGVLFAVRSI